MAGKIIIQSSPLIFILGMTPRLRIVSSATPASQDRSRGILERD
jgi:hypothetical protein